MAISLFDIAKANRIKTYLKKKNLEFKAQSQRIIETPDGFIVRQEVMFPTKEQAEIFSLQHELAQKAEKFFEE